MLVPDGTTVRIIERVLLNPVQGPDRRQGPIIGKVVQGQALAVNRQLQYRMLTLDSVRRKRRIIAVVRVNHPKKTFLPNPSLLKIIVGPKKRVDIKRKKKMLF
jgi:hypothetical protein